MIIQIIGLPGSGKTTLATALADGINAVHLNADYVRATINSEHGFKLLYFYAIIYIGRLMGPINLFA